MARRPASTLSRMRPTRRRALPARLAMGALRLMLGLVLVSLLWVLAYRFIDPPLTVTMAGDLVAGRGAARQWLELERMDRDMVRAAIAAEDSKFCSHKGFDLDAIEAAMQRNASGGRIRGGSTISQQTAKNAFLWQGGGYFRKALEAWFTLLIEAMWGKPRIMEVYLNIAETGIGTYGASAGSLRYFGHDATSLSRTEAARIAAVLPLPKKRGAVAPRGFARRYGSIIEKRIGQVARDRLDSCVYRWTSAPRDQPPPARSRPRLAPGDDYESAAPAPAPLPPPEEVPATAPDPLDEPPVPVDNRSPEPPEPLAPLASPVVAADPPSATTSSVPQ